ncbi:MAG: hypothetical protein Q7K65_03095 [Candidatus Buchananbacteria bacterium]|nr:hypothetical protein [Candidatus Buchananbacteria bacterium]
MSQGNSGMEILQQLLDNTDQAVKSIEGRSQAAIEEQLAGIEKKFSEAEKIKDQNERDIRLKVLEAEFRSLSKDAAQEEKDLAEAVFGLNGMLETMGAEYDNLGQLSESDQAGIKKAENAIAEAEQDLLSAQGKRWFRSHAVSQAELAVQETKSRLKQLQDESRKNARQRLMHADMSTSLQEFQVRVEKTIAIMTRRLNDITTQLKSVSVRKSKAFEIKEAAAQALEQLDSNLNEAEASLRGEEELLETMINGTKEHSAQTEKVSNLRAQVEDLRGNRNTAFTLFQSKEKFSAELEIHERTQMKLRDNQRMWIVALKSDTEERVVSFKSRLEAMKAAADQEIAKELDDMGSQVDQNNAEYMARVGSASDRLRMDKLEKHPERIRKIVEVQQAQAEAVSAIRQRETKAIDDFRKRYGIDPTRSSFFHYEKGSPEPEGV